MQNSLKMGSQLPPRIRALLSAAPGVYLVGGCVRDALRGDAPSDYDLAVAGDPAGFAARLARCAESRVVMMGKPGASVYRVPFQKRVFDVSPLQGGHIEADLIRRDFTINAMAWEPVSDRIIDPTGGRGDLGRQIRMVSASAFERDPLRLLRAFRLAAGLRLDIETATLDAIRACRHGIGEVAGERIREECLKFFRSGDSAPYLDQMAGSGLLESLLPELSPLKGIRPNRHHRFDAFTHTLAAYGHLEALLRSPGETVPESAPPIGAREAALLKWALVLHDIGKPTTASADASGADHYYDHEKKGADLAVAVCERLRFSKEETRFVETVVRHHLRPLHLYRLHGRDRLSRRAVSRFFLRCGADTPHILIHSLADYLGKGGTDPAEVRRFKAFIHLLADRFYNDFKVAAALPPLLTGRDLIQELKLTPSPVFKRLLTAVEEARLAGMIRTRKAAIEMAADLLSEMDAT